MLKKDALYSLDFAPLAAWPASLPPLVCHHILIAGFDRTEDTPAWPIPERGPVELDLAQALVDAYPRLSLPELARLWVVLQKQTPHLDFTKIAAVLCPQYNLQNSESLRDLLQVLAHTPQSFQNWVSAKQLAARELAILKAIPDLEKVEALLQTIALLQPSHAEGALLLELALELHLMQTPTERVLEKSQNLASWRMDLETLRKPLSAQRDQEAKKTLHAWPWPQTIQSRWVRQGDIAGVEVKFQVGSAREMKLRLEALQRVQTKMESDGWN